MSALYLLRHAHAEAGALSDLDFDRKLSAQGQHQAIAAAKWLARARPAPQRIVASPAQRTRQTALAAAKALEIDSAEIIWERSIYEATAGTLLDIIQRNLAPGPLLVVGHNPALELVLRFFAEEYPGQPFLAMATGTIAQLGWANGGNPLQQNSQLLALVNPGSDH
ncbi:MAG: histidine phosphatase family protein [Wenzhouxiangellaceae bacterium]